MINFLEAALFFDEKGALEAEHKETQCCCT